MAYKWLQDEWKTSFFPALEQAETEADIRRVCEEQIAAWRARPSLKKESSLRVPLNDTRNEVIVRLEGERRQFVLQYLQFTTEEWTRMNAGTDESLQKRHENQQFLRDPDAIVTTAIALLSSEHWYDIATGLAACTGRRLTEVLKTAEFTEKTDFSVTFKGQLKAKGEVVFEIPTLAPASLIVEAVTRLRSLLDTRDIEKRDVSHKYSQIVRERADHHFSALVPVRAGDHDGLYTHLFRSVYATIAVLLYCPLSITPMHFMATIQGHYRYLEAGNETERRNYASTAHYSDYRILGSDGQVDNRQGIRLGTSGVVLLEVFQPKHQGEKAVKTTDQIQETTDQDQEQKQPRKKGNNYPITVDETQFNRTLALRSRLGQRTYTETQKLLLDTYDQGPAPAPTDGETQQPDIIAVILATIDQDKAYKEFRADEKATLAVELLDETLASVESLQAFLVSAIVKEAKFLVGVTQRHAGLDVAKMTMTELAGIKDKRAAKERIRRVVLAIGKYNDSVQSNNDRWYTNPRSIQKLAGSRYPIINEYITEHQEEIDGMNAKYKLNDRHNHKPDSIETVIVVPDAPETTEPATASEPEPTAQEA